LGNWRRERWKKAPRTNIQAPEKIQGPIPQSFAHVLVEDAILSVAVKMAVEI
jgi:hypothetical protein